MSRAPCCLPPFQGSRALIKLDDLIAALDVNDGDQIPREECLAKKAG